MPRTKGSINKPKTTTVQSVHNVPIPSDSSPNLDLDGQAEISEAPTKSKKNTFVCERCGEETEQYLNVIDTNVLTLVANFHRESPKIFRICRKCCNELSEVIDQWYLEVGKDKFNQYKNKEINKKG